MTRSSFSSFIYFCDGQGVRVSLRAPQLIHFPDPIKGMTSTLELENSPEKLTGCLKVTKCQSYGKTGVLRTEPIKQTKIRNAKIHFMFHSSCILPSPNEDYPIPPTPSHPAHWSFIIHELILNTKNKLLKFEIST